MEHALSTPNSKWGKFVSLGGTINNDPAPVTTYDGRIVVFARGSDNNLWHIWQHHDHKTWADWSQLNNVGIKGTPAALRGADGRIRAYWRGGDDKLYTVTGKTPTGGFTSTPVKLASDLSADPTAGWLSDGRNVVTWRSADTSTKMVFHNSGVNDDSYATERNLGGTVPEDATIAMTLDGGGHLNLAVRGMGDTLWVRRQGVDWSASFSSAWQYDAPHGSGVVQPVACTDANGRARYFSMKSDGTITTVADDPTQQYGVRGMPGSVEQAVLGNPEHRMYATRDAVGRIRLFYTDTEGRARCLVQNALSGNAFTPEEDFSDNRTPGGCKPVKKGGGFLAAFVRGTDNALWWAEEKTTF